MIAKEKEAKQIPTNLPDALRLAAENVEEVESTEGVDYQGSCLT